MKNKEMISIIFGILLIALSIGGVLYQHYLIENTEPIITEETKCYDRYGREIIGLVCEEEIMPWYVYPFFILIVFMFLISLILIGAGMIIKSIE